MLTLSSAVGDHPPNTEERYISAINSTNLRVQADRGGGADILIAVGWSRAYFGTALMRLQVKPNRQALKSIHEYVTQQAEAWHIDRPDSVATAALTWWLKCSCTYCRGRRFEVAPGSPYLSNRRCRACKGTGVSRPTHGHDCKRLIDWINGCKMQAVMSVRKNLRRA